MAAPSYRPDSMKSEWADNAVVHSIGIRENELTRNSSGEKLVHSSLGLMSHSGLRVQLVHAS